MDKSGPVKRQEFPDAMLTPSKGLIGMRMSVTFSFTPPLDAPCLVLLRFLGESSDAVPLFS